MTKNKTQQHFDKISLLKERLQHLNTEIIVSRLANFNKSNDIAKAYKLILKDRGVNDYFEEL